MKAAVLDRHVLAVLQVEKNLEKLKKSSELLELIQKGLNDYQGFSFYLMIKTFRNLVRNKRDYLDITHMESSEDEKS
ncbi:dynein axonemal heavy chain 7-like isoform X3 [Tachypleus tridentatus]|uniref:dynein axonemal heavy chain 7-like isoform X3 n=1 Tax=Tachypleus tridentatus TaxID=6853 RepID=UPI003FD3C3E2